jgi:hypothetical protein
MPVQNNFICNGNGSLSICLNLLLLLIGDYSTLNIEIWLLHPQITYMANKLVRK